MNNPWISFRLGLAVLLTTSLPVFACPHYALGIPATTDYKFCYTSFAVGYNGKTKSAAWVQYVLSKSSVSNDTPRQPDDTLLFQRELELPFEDSATPRDYRGSSYDRGHMAAVRLMDFNRKTVNESYTLTAVLPQLPAFNRYEYKGDQDYGIWAALEGRVEYWVKQTEILWVTAGPIYNSSEMTIGNGIPIPSAFYMVLFVPGDEPKNDVALAYLIPHKALKKNTLDDYIVSIAEVEQKSGMQFLKQLGHDRRRALLHKAGPPWKVPQHWNK